MSTLDILNPSINVNTLELQLSFSFTKEHVEAIT